MRKILLVFIFSILIIFILFENSLSICYAHSGNTDSNGGHTNSETGEYHYHHGYPAHQHTGGKCPYDFHDNTGTGNNSGASSSSGSSLENVSIYEIIIYIIIGFIVLSSIFIYIMEAKETKKKRIEEEKKRIEDEKIRIEEEKKRIEEEKKRIEEAEKKRVEFEKEREEMIKKYGGISIYKLVKIPFGSEIGTDNLPREINPSYKWGEKYTFYLSSKGKFHRRSCKYSIGGTPVNAHNLNYNNQPCSICNPKKPNTEWVNEYIKIQNIKKKYNID